MFKKIKKLCVAILALAIAVSFFSCSNESDSGSTGDNGGNTASNGGSNSGNGDNTSNGGDNSGNGDNTSNGGDNSGNGDNTSNGGDNSGNGGDSDTSNPPTPTEYTITYVLNGGTNDAANPAKYTAENLPITLAAPTLGGRTFEGWYENADFSGDAVTTIAAGSTGAKTFCAKWNTVLQSITVTIGTYNDLSVTQTTENNVVTLTADASAKWYVNRVLQGSESSETFTFDTAEKMNGVYDILAVDSEGRSAQVEIKVQ